MGRKHAHAEKPLSQHGKQRIRKPSRKVVERAQDLFAYEALAQSGFMWLGGGRYSVTLKLSDISYSLAPEEIQSELVEKYAHFLNGHTSDIKIQVSVINRVLDPARLTSEVEIAQRGDSLDSWREEYNRQIRARLVSGRNNTVSERYVTVTVQADSPGEARAALARIVAEDAAMLREVGGCVAEPLDGEQRVNLLRSITRPSERGEFHFSDLVGEKVTTKDVICPWAITTKDKDRLTISDGVGEWVWRSFVLRRIPPWLSDRLVKELADIPIPLVVSIHFDPIDQADGLAMVKSQIAAMDIQRSTEQRRLAKQQLSADLIPHELQNSYEEAAELRAQLEQSNEKLFATTIVVGVRGASEKELAENADRLVRACAKHSCTLEKLTYMQVAAFNALLPLGVCDLPMSRTLTTAAAAVLVPFTSEELLEPGGVFYGINALSRNLIVADRARRMNANAWVLGTTGSGKSMFAKLEMLQRIIRYPSEQVLIIDPEREYGPLAEVVGGRRVVISAGSHDSINALDMDKTVRDTDSDPVRDKSQAFLAMCEVLVGGAGLSAGERSVIDRVATQVLRDFWEHEDAAQPTLTEVWNELKKQPEPEAARVAAGLEIYATGSFSGFARPTNIDPSARVVVYDLADLAHSSQTFGMMLVLEDMWGRLRRNKARGVRTSIYIDEAHVLFRNSFSAEYTQNLFQRVRKYGGGVTGVTQNIEELLGSERARLMLANAASVAMLAQEPTDADALQKLLHLSAQQRSYMVNTSSGCGLFKIGPVAIPFDNRLDPDSPLITLFSTSTSQRGVAA